MVSYIFRWLVVVFATTQLTGCFTTAFLMDRQVNSAVSQRCCIQCMLLRLTGVRLGISFVIALCGLIPRIALCNELFRNTHLIELSQGSQLSQVMRASQIGGFETANGKWISFKEWYSTTWTVSQFTLMTQMTSEFGIVWGASTGEYGQKYTIDPSLKFGLVVRKQIDKDSSIAFKATAIIGGWLREKSCTADYGEIGGTQKVNCRLAATTLSPNDTLQYMYNMRPLNPYLFLLEYRITF